MAETMETEPIAWATAWQTNYTGNVWHFARQAAFSSSDIERGIVKNITQLYAIPCAPGRRALSEGGE